MQPWEYVRDSRFSGEFSRDAWFSFLYSLLTLLYGTTTFDSETFRQAYHAQVDRVQRPESS
jgi:hypothetical protein